VGMAHEAQWGGGGGGGVGPSQRRWCEREIRQGVQSECKYAADTCGMGMMGWGGVGWGEGWIGREARQGGSTVGSASIILATEML
jgi:hypothetical protein